MADYTKDLDDLQKRIDALGRRIDWGYIWDTAFAMESTMNMTLETFIQQNGSRQQFIDRNNGVKNETTENESQVCKSKTSTRDIVI
jgi:hypothetical protein